MNSILIGTWSLAKHGRFTPTGEYTPSGSNIAGQLTYTADGFMNVHITLTTEPTQLSDIIVYSGRYTLSAGKVIHHIEISPSPKRRNTAEIRFFELNDQKLILRTEKMENGFYEIQWQKRPQCDGTEVT